MYSFVLKPGPGTQGSGTLTRACRAASRLSQLNNSIFVIILFVFKYCYDLHCFIFYIFVVTCEVFQN